MYVYVLHFESLGHLTRAFDQILDEEKVESCMIEPGESRVRFLARPSCGDALVERLYLSGGLSWCTRHEHGKGED